MSTCSVAEMYSVHIVVDVLVIYSYFASYLALLHMSLSKL